MDDVPIRSSRSKRSCAFADDEAEESEHDADQEMEGNDENSGDSDSESDAVISSRSSESEDTNDGKAADLHSAGFRSGDLGQSRNVSYSVTITVASSLVMLLSSEVTYIFQSTVLLPRSGIPFSFRKSVEFTRFHRSSWTPKRSG